MRLHLVELILFSTYAELRAASQQKCHVRSYLEAQQPHLLRAYDAEFLVDAIDRWRTATRRLRQQQRGEGRANESHAAPPGWIGHHTPRVT